VYDFPIRNMDFTSFFWDWAVDPHIRETVAEMPSLIQIVHWMRQTLIAFAALISY